MTGAWKAVSRFACERRRALVACATLTAFAAVAVMLAGRWDEFTVALAGAPLGILAIAAALQVASLLTRSESWKLCDGLCDRLRTRSATVAARGMPADLGAIPAARRRLIELSYFGGLTHIQLARLLPSPV